MRCLATVASTRPAASLAASDPDRRHGPAINYAAGLTGVRLRHYVVGSALGMVPGSLAYAALGAYGTEPWKLVAAATALVLLAAGGVWWGRRLGLRGANETAGSVW